MLGRRPRKPANNLSFVLNFDGFQAQEFNYFLVNFTLLLLFIFFFFCNSQFRMSTISSMNVNVLAYLRVEFGPGNQYQYNILEVCLFPCGFNDP